MGLGVLLHEVLPDGLLCSNDFFDRRDVEILVTCRHPLFFVVVSQLLVDKFFDWIPGAIEMHGRTKNEDSIEHPLLHIGVQDHIGHERCFSTTARIYQQSA